MTRPAPPLPAIQAFLAATRAPSFHAAADELGLSPSAFSRRIRALEASLGVTLYDRTGPSPRLTAAGERYGASLAPAIAAIEAAGAAIREPDADRLRLMCPPSFSGAWLMPQLRGYFDRLGRNNVELVVTRDLDALRLGRADLAISIASPELRAFESEPLLSLRAAVVSAPKLAGGIAPPRSVADLARCPLLSLDLTPDIAQDFWPSWLAGAGFTGVKLPEPTRFATWTLMYQAAANGLGVALATPAIAEDHLVSGRLKPCFASDAPLGASYRLAYASSAVRRRPEVRALARWLVERMAASMETYARAVSIA